MVKNEILIRDFHFGKREPLLSQVFQRCAYVINRVVKVLEASLDVTICDIKFLYSFAVNQFYRAWRGHCLT